MGDKRKADGSHSKAKHSGWYRDQVGKRLIDHHVSSRPLTQHPFLPVMKRQVVLDTSDSESEKCEVECKSYNERDQEGFSDQKGILPQAPDSCCRLSEHSSKSLRACSNESEPKDNLRFVLSPHPDVICRRSGPIQNYNSSDESSHSGSSSAKSSLPKVRFTMKRASSFSGDPEKLSENLLGNSLKVDGNRKGEEQMFPPKRIYKPSELPIVGQNLAGQFKDVFGRPVVQLHRSLGPLPPIPSNQSVLEPIEGRFIPSEDNFLSDNSRNHPSSSRMVHTITTNSNNGDVATRSLQTVQPVDSAQSEPKKSFSSTNEGQDCQTHNVITLGSPTKGLCFPSVQVPSSNYADEGNRSHQTLSCQQSFPRLPVKLEPSDFDHSTARYSPVGSQIPQNLCSIQVPEHQTINLPSMNMNSHSGSFSHSSHLQPDVVPNPLISTRSASEPSSAPHHFPSSSRNPTSYQTSTYFGSGSRSPIASLVDPPNNNSSSSPNLASPSSRSYLNSNLENIDPSDQGCQITSELSSSGIVVMSLIHKKNKIAGSSYNSATGQVYFLESISDNFEFDRTVLALRSVSPSVVVLPSSGAAHFVKELKAKIEGDQTLGDCQFQCLSPRYFAYGFARRTVLESTLWEGCLTFRSEDAKTSAIVSNINLNDERLVCAFGGLIYHLSTSCSQVGVGLSPTPIKSVQYMKLSHKLWLDTESYKNLNIFDPAEHPSSFKWSSSNRDDGKSVFGMFERFCSSVGMTKLKSFLANPVNCRRTLEKRHEVMDFYLNMTNYNAVEALKRFASQMSSSSVVVNYLSLPTLRGGHWKHIYRHIYYTVSYAEVCRSNGNQSELFRELGSTIVDAVYSMAHNLERVVDLVNMENNETFIIKYGFHPPLDAAKEKFSRLKTAMDKVTPYEFDSLPPFITRIQMMYIPEMKFLLSIPFWAPNLAKEELNLPNLEFKFTANKTAFYKSRRCYELDELLGDAHTDIINEESMIIHSLRNHLKKNMHHIVGMAQKIAEIECIFALAKVAREERYTKPEILDTGIIEIRGGWHPLLDVPSNEIITNDTVSSSDASLVKLIYGPNASGKSMYLKQVGLIVYLAHVGSYVPAVSARVGLFSRILARTTIEESVISMSSTMLSELKKLQDAAMGSTKDSLVILDEVGKGSTEVNCVAVVTSVVNYFLSQGFDCPHVLISTHTSGISDFVTSPPHSPESRNLFELLIMDYTITEGEIVFLYKIRRGTPDGSFVFEVLENSEFAAPVVKTARTVLEALRTGENFLPYCETRIQRSHKYLNFIRKFVNIDMSKPGYLEKLQHKIQRYYEKPSY